MPGRTPPESGPHGTAPQPHLCGAGWRVVTLIGAILDRSPTAARQLASRARRRVQARPADPGTDLSGQRRVVDAFLAASREGRFDDLLVLLDPDVVLRGDATAARMGGDVPQLRGSAVVGRFLSRRARGAVAALIDGAAGAVAIADGRVRVALSFTIRDGRIIDIDAVADPERLREIDVEILG